MTNKYLEAVKDNIDSFGILAQLDGDGGDSILHEADLVFCTYINEAINPSDEYLFYVPEVCERFYNNISKFVILDKSHAPSYGLFRRHPDLSKWYSDWDRGSRDQLHSMVAMAIAAPKAFDAVVANWQRRFYLFTTNTLGNSQTTTKRKFPDFTGPGMWAYAIRCSAIRHSKKVSKLLRPVMELLDLSLLGNSLIRVYWHGKNKDETDGRNHLKAMGLSKLVGDTFVAKLARLVYRKMPIKFPDRLYNKNDYTAGATQEVYDYFNSHGGVSGLADLWKPVIKWILE